jgi:hypothetical protein
MIGSIEEGVAIYKQKIAEFASWFKESLCHEATFRKSNELDIDTARSLLEKRTQNSVKFEECKKQIRSMAEVLALTEDEGRKFFAEADLNYAVLVEPFGYFRPK